MHSLSFEARFTKSQLVEQICTFNTSAPREWLEGFEFAALERYLMRLRDGFVHASTGGADPSAAA